ncbi:DNA cytosine methyltransferase [Pedobacter heparinus]|uniref:Cytosine-specific methyltransferase n=1 Tax=Pedobacter heparinus (strain ATCC 13125 / DSM 2366 / CIP 104194 / JCM 7457 / NBRC 12017 / NCIMB 9290 / NRRL B-14731 / HIM 762-3) TaxID=485917 RepID=C6Y2U0_PEDHD|nr:DNA cytosine methyltransferase [Pedobacter heparinus]ACU03153.1 DNA-cytosine methyltransferase [Pedobacter heparinus DSM 2366]
MLEFYYKFHNKKFKIKSEELANEIEKILINENLTVIESSDNHIPLGYKSLLGDSLFRRLSNIYYTIRQNDGKNHFLLKKYLPEKKRKPRSANQFADFFSGAGGLSQGLINAGFQPVFVNDNYTDALETYYFNHSLPLNQFYNGDIRKLVENFSQYKHLFKGVKIICGGPPCQGFSTANRQNFEVEETTKQKRFIEDERNVLYKYFVKLIGLIQPDYFIMENVKGMMRVEKQIEEDIQRETNHEYSFIPLELDAQNFDIPQSRKRYILIGGKNFMFIEQIKKNIYSKKNGTSKYKLADALYGLPGIKTNPYKLNPDYESEVHGYAIRKLKLEQNKFLKEINGSKEMNYLFNHKSRYNNDNDLEIFRTLPEGENSLHPSVQKLSNYNNRNHIFKDKYYKLKRNEVSKTITSHMKYDCHMYIHPDQARGLSPREAARIQTFPDDYVFRGSLNDWYKQIGNAVPVKMAQVIAQELKKF